MCAEAASRRGRRCGLKEPAPVDPDERPAVDRTPRGCGAPELRRPLLEDVTIVGEVRRLQAELDAPTRSRQVERSRRLSAVGGRAASQEIRPAAAIRIEESIPPRPMLFLRLFTPCSVVNPRRRPHGECGRRRPATHELVMEKSRRRLEGLRRSARQNGEWGWGGGGVGLGWGGRCVIYIDAKNGV